VTRGLSTWSNVKKF